MSDVELFPPSTFPSERATEAQSKNYVAQHLLKHASEEVWRGCMICVAFWWGLEENMKYINAGWLERQITEIVIEE